MMTLTPAAVDTRGNARPARPEATGAVSGGWFYVDLYLAASDGSHRLEMNMDDEGLFGSV